MFLYWEEYVCVSGGSPLQNIKSERAQSLWCFFITAVCFLLCQKTFCAENIHRKLMTCLGVWLLPFSFLFLCFLLNCSHLCEIMEIMECFFKASSLNRRMDPYCCIKH